MVTVRVHVWVCQLQSLERKQVGNNEKTCFSLFSSPLPRINELITSLQRRSATRKERASRIQVEENDKIGALRPAIRQQLSFPFLSPSILTTYNVLKTATDISNQLQKLGKSSPLNMAVMDGTKFTPTKDRMDDGINYFIAATKFVEHTVLTIFSK